MHTTLGSWNPGTAEFQDPTIPGSKESGIPGSWDRLGRFPRYIVFVVVSLSVNSWLELVTRFPGWTPTWLHYGYTPGCSPVARGLLVQVEQYHKIIEHAHDPRILESLDCGIPGSHDASITGAWDPRIPGPWNPRTAGSRIQGSGERGISGSLDMSKLQRVDIQPL